MTWSATLDTTNLTTNCARFVIPITYVATLTSAATKSFPRWQVPTGMTLIPLEVSLAHGSSASGGTVKCEWIKGAATAIIDQATAFETVADDTAVTTTDFLESSLSAGDTCFIKLTEATGGGGDTVTDFTIVITCKALLVDDTAP